MLRASPVRYVIQSLHSDTSNHPAGRRTGAPPEDEERRLKTRRARLARLAAGLFVLAAGLVGTGSYAAREGPPEGGAAWIRGQLLLERPAASLGAANQARMQADRLRAEWLLGEIAERYPLIGDYADLMRAEVLLESARHAEASQVAAGALESHPKTPLRPELLALQGHALAGSQHEVRAREKWRAALDSTRDADLRASLLLATAESQERTKEPDGAIETYRVLWHLYPLSEEANRAGARLEELEEVLHEPLRSAVDWRRRADNLYRGRLNAEAVEAYEKAVSMGLSKAQDTRARRQRAQALFRMRDYPRAVDGFENLPQQDDVPIWHARSLARAGRVPEAIEAFERIGSQRRGANTLRARFLAGLLLEGRGKTERAREYFESLAGGRTTSAMRNASLWRLGWGAYQEGRYADAIGRIDRLLGEERDPIGALRARYWRARALEALGRGADPNPATETAARVEFEAIALEFPLTYYGWRARTRLPDFKASVDSAGTDRQRPAPGRRRLKAERLERIRILVEAGLDERAVEELARIARRVGGLDDRLELAQLYRSAGHFRGAQRMVVDAYQLVLSRGPEPTLEGLWWHAWPAAYPDLVEAETSRPGSVEAALVYSIMREESGFRPRVVSPVGARGLLQIMQPTGERLARSVGHENFEPDDLFEPPVNIRLGSHYLGELSQRFGGRLSAAIASYNAGPEAVSDWLEAGPDLEDDEWVESIPYDQTRSYVKRVMRSLQAYRLLY
ncbi:MAG: transglycosylase SLT domain-containing protein [Myxococcota bacterium]|nr:transglycosylase SLT domain-containing protein [Myxococcota bacterium]